MPARSIPLADSRSWPARHQIACRQKQSNGHLVQKRDDRARVERRSLPAADATTTRNSGCSVNQVERDVVALIVRDTTGYTGTSRELRDRRIVLIAPRLTHTELRGPVPQPAQLAFAGR